MQSNFEFLKKDFPVLADYGEKAEKYLYSDSNSCLMKLGMIGETIVNLMFQYDNVLPPYQNDAVHRIETLRAEGLINGDLADVLHTLRKKRNKAVHENYSSINDGQSLLEMAFSVCVWFYQVYGDYSFEPAKFVMPERKSAVTSTAAEKKKEDEQAEKLARQAEEKAKNAPAVDTVERKKKAAFAANQRPRNEAETRFLIDEQLRKVGWEANTKELRYSKGTRPKKGHNIAIAEWPTDSNVGIEGFADYALFVGLQMIATVEAKAIHKDIPSVIDNQCDDYSSLIRKEDDQYVISQWGKYKVPFTFATNGRPYIEQLDTKSGIWFRDLRNPSNVPKALRGWMSPTGLMDMLNSDPGSSNRDLADMSFDLLTDPNGLHLRDYQVVAVKAAENAVINGQQKILLAMATGTGKTRVALGMIYRFLKTNRFNRILFLVDRNALGQQAFDKFSNVKIEDLKTLNQIYNVNQLGDVKIEKETRLQIATVQSMIRRILYNDGESMPAVTDYDLIIIDEAHRGYILDKEMTEEQMLYTDQRDYQGKYRAVIDYFDAVKIGLTATPALQTTQIFGQPVYQYTYRQAVVEGWLVDHDAPHELKTKLSSNGIHYKKGEKVPIYDPVTNEIINSGELSDDLDFDIDSFNKEVLSENFNRAVLEEISNDIDPENPLGPDGQGKTLIYAVNDQHADMIVKILKEIYGDQGIDTSAIMKITGATGGGNQKKIEDSIRRFINEKYPSIVVTVDLLTTGIDVPSITTLVFMRRVKSRILFEQMMGRATRLCPEIHKRIFQIYDPVRIYEVLEPITNMKPVVTQPAQKITQVMDLILNAEDDKTVEFNRDQLLAKVERRKKRISQKTLLHFEDISGKKLNDVIIEIQHTSAADIKERVQHYYEAFKYLQNAHYESTKPIVISDKPDELVSHTRGYGDSNQQPEEYLESFSRYINENKDQIAALNIICTKPGDLTLKELRSLTLRLDRDGYTAAQLNTAISETSNVQSAADIISLIRKYALDIPLMNHEERIHKAVEKLVSEHDFNKVQMGWIKRIEKYLINDSVINVSVFDEDDRFKRDGGFRNINKRFNMQLADIIKELNGYLYEDGRNIA